MLEEWCSRSVVSESVLLRALGWEKADATRQTDTIMSWQISNPFIHYHIFPQPKLRAVLKLVPTHYFQTCMYSFIKSGIRFPLQKSNLSTYYIYIIWGRMWYFLPACTMEEKSSEHNKSSKGPKFSHPSQSSFESKPSLTTLLLYLNWLHIGSFYYVRNQE